MRAGTPRPHQVAPSEGPAQSIRQSCPSKVPRLVSENSRDCAEIPKSPEKQMLYAVNLSERYCNSSAKLQ